MIRLRWNEQCDPRYMTASSAAADLRARREVVIPPRGRVAVPTGVWIDGVDWDKIPDGAIPELQVRARSGLAIKHGIMLANGVGTVDADFPDEIAALLFNSSDEPFVIKPGDRVAQLALALVWRIPGLEVGGTRQGGFGSTGR